MKTNPHILLGVTGSIAAYKAAELVRRFKERDWDVSVIMTRGATEFITPLTLQTLSQNPVGVEMFERKAEWRPAHISYADRAALLLIAPCTANVIAKLANGLSDDLLTCTALACPAPLVVAPAMNVHMWDHPATQANVETLQRRGGRIVDVGSGDLACGYQGRGRMAAIEDILRAVDDVLKSSEQEGQA